MGCRVLLWDSLGGVFMKIALVFLVFMSLAALSAEDIMIPMPDDTDLEVTAGGSAVSIDFTDPFGNNGNPEVGVVCDDPTEDPLYTTILLNTWQITYASNVLGLDHLTLGGTPVIGFCSSIDDKLYFANIADMTEFNVSNLHSGNGSAFGCTVTPPVMTTTDFTDTNLYEGLWNSWIYYFNPASYTSRGITRDGNNGLLWLARTNGFTGSFAQYIGCMTQGNPGSIVWYNVMAGLNNTQRLSGIADFVLPNGHTCLAYNIYSSEWVRFREFTGYSLEYLGYAVLPVSGIQASFGICYCNTRDSFYWSYQKNSNFYVSEFSVNITALTRSTWGQIKATF